MVYNMKFSIIFISFVLCTQLLFSQENISKRSINLEIGGAGLLSSINYEQNLWTKSNNSFKLRTGFGYFPVIVNTKFAAGTYSFILGANYLKAFKNHHVVIGISNSFAHSIISGTNSENGNYIFSNFVIPAIGYRFQKMAIKKLYFGIGYSPVISFTGYSVNNEFMQFKNHFYIQCGLNL